MNIETQLKAIEADVNEIKENVTKVYDAGKSYQNNEFWKAFTNGGKRSNYREAFTTAGFNKNNFFPTYNITPVDAEKMFMSIAIESVDEQVDMEELENKMGIIFDFSKCKKIVQCFAGALFKTLNVIDITNITEGSADFAFYGGYVTLKLKRINRLIIGENTRLTDTMFGYASELNYIGFEGVIAKTITLSYSPLIAESAKKLIMCLKNYADTDYELQYRLTLKSTVWEALNSAEAPPSGNTWQDYVYSLGWNYA
jgi:hypothetical protein